MCSPLFRSNSNYNCLNCSNLHDCLMLSHSLQCLTKLLNRNRGRNGSPDNTSHKCSIRERSRPNVGHACKLVYKPGLDTDLWEYRDLYSFIVTNMKPPGDYKPYQKQKKMVLVSSSLSIMGPESFWWDFKTVSHFGALHQAHKNQTAFSK